MRVAAIDIGTNSLHMIVAEVRADLSFGVIDREKEMVRLGAGGLGGRPLTGDAMRAALQVLASFRRIAESHRVDEVVAVATSAVREASNGGEFLRAVQRKTGIRPRVITGTEEAALVHRAALYGAGGADVNVVVDIGGGSVEITRGTGPTPDRTFSLKLGVIRLMEEFVHSDPLSADDERHLVRAIARESRQALDEIARAGFSRVIATSGTALNLGAMVAAQEGSPGATLRNRRIAAEQVGRLRERLTRLPLVKQLKVPGLDPRRADLAVTGAILLDEILKGLGSSEVTLCDLSLREGLVLDYISRHRREIAHVDQYPDVRRRSTIELAERCGYRAEHARHVARVALALFDQTRGCHHLTDREREWLEYAALLHDVGAHISFAGHHKHSYYLIKNGGLRGFEPDEIEIMALIARHHRRAAAKASDKGYRDLGRKRRRAVRVLAAILRLAESLDRSHAQVVSAVELRDGNAEARLRVRATADAELEVWAAMRQRAPFEQMLGKPLRVELAPASRAARSGRSQRRAPGPQALKPSSPRQ